MFIYRWDESYDTPLKSNTTLPVTLECISDLCCDLSTFGIIIQLLFSSITIRETISLKITKCITHSLRTCFLQQNEIITTGVF